MIKIVKSALFAFLLNMFLSRLVEAQTITAASCNESDVSTALARITTDGTTVVIPSGNCAWTASLVYTQTNSCTLQGAGALSYSSSTINATGTNTTIIQHDTNHNGGDPPMLGIATISGKS